MLTVPSAEDGADPVRIATPACLTYTRRGEPAHLTPDVLATLPAEARAFQVSLVHFMDHLPHTHVSSCPGGGRAYFGSAPTFALATARDPITFDLNAKRSNDSKSTFVSTPVGVKKLTVQQYMEWVHATQPHAFVSLPDETHSCEHAAKKKIDASLARTETWLDACEALRVDAGHQKKVPMFASVQGGCCLESRRKSARAAASRGDSVFGFSIGGLGTSEVPGDMRREILRAVRGELPRNKPVHVAGVSSPLETVALLEAGVDLVDNSFCHGATVAGKALWFPVAPTAPVFPGESPEKERVVDAGVSETENKRKRKNPDSDDETRLAEWLFSGADAFCLNLWSVRYKMDARPISETCECVTCTNHTRAYLHHLLQCREMTVSVLLDAHNQFHYLRFVEEARLAIGASTFDEFARFHRERAARETHAMPRDS